MKVNLNIVDKDVNPLELIMVAEHLDAQGTRYADIRKGNDCIWVSRGQINEYFIFRGGKLVDIQID